MFREEPRNFLLLGSDFELFAGVSLDGFDSLGEGFIAFNACDVSLTLLMLF